MDRAIESLVNDFSKAYSLEKLDQSKQFEHFSAHITIDRHYGQTFSTMDVVVGNGGDGGMDAIGILVNGVLVPDLETLEEQDQHVGSLDVTFIFIQSETGGHFSSDKIGNFARGVKDFFSATPSIPRNEQVNDAAEIGRAIYDRSPKFARGNPACVMYYVTTGRWTGDIQLENHRRDVIIELEGTEYFSKVEFHPVGMKEIQRLYQQAKNSIPKKFEFLKRVTVPAIEGVKQSYVGFLPATVFVELLKDEQGGINHRLFDDNVRDWLQLAPVNAEIKATLASDARARFVLMNNGVTIIARSLETTGDEVRIENFSIVNGCQTSHMVYESRDSLSDLVLIPIRLIATENEEVINDIIRATNRQTEIKADQFFALHEFSKELELYFQSFPPDRRLYFERRISQYASVETIEKTRVILPANVIRAYAAMFLKIPHGTTRNYGALRERVGKTIFAQGHKKEPYYTSAYALYRLERYFNTKKLPAKYKPARFHILYAIRMIANNDVIPRESSNEMARFCEKINSQLWDDFKWESLVWKAVGAIDTAAGGSYDRDEIRTENFTSLVNTWIELELGIDLKGV